MNLYSIEFCHYAPRDSEDGLKCLLLAENDEQVYEWLKAEPTLPEGPMFNNWGEQEEEGETYGLYDDESNLIGSESFKERMLRRKGDLDDENIDCRDAYYGITLYGWRLLKENVTTDYSELQALRILYTIK